MSADVWTMARRMSEGQWRVMIGAALAAAPAGSFAYERDGMLVIEVPRPTWWWQRAVLPGRVRSLASDNVKRWAGCRPRIEVQWRKR